MRSIGKEPLIIEEGSRVEEDCILYEHTNTNCSAKTTKEKRRKKNEKKEAHYGGRSKKLLPPVMLNMTMKKEHGAMN